MRAVRTFDNAATGPNAKEHGFVTAGAKIPK
jgi:hypothetical protein